MTTDWLPNLEAHQQIAALMAALQASEQRLQQLERRQHEAGQWAISFVAMHQACLTAIKSGGGAVAHFERLFQSVAGELHKVAHPIAEFRTELAAVVNRLRMVERNLALAEDRVTDMSSLQEQSERRLRETHEQSLTALDGLTHAGEILDVLKSETRESLQDLEARLVGWTDPTRRIEQIEEIVSPFLERFSGIDQSLVALKSDIGQATAKTEEIEHKLAPLAQRFDGVDHDLAMLRADIDQTKIFTNEIEHKLPPLVERFDGIDHDLVVLRADIEQAQANTSEIEHMLPPLAERFDDISQDLVGLRADIDQAKAHTNEIVNRPHLYICNAERGVFLAKSHDLISNVVSTEGLWDDHIVALLDDIASTRGEGTALDIGAQFGFITVPMAQRFSRVLSFEPNDFSFRMLRANIALNGLTNVECHNQPLFSSNAVLSLGRQELQETAVPRTKDGSFDPMVASNSGSYLFSQFGSGTFSHQARTVDSFELEDVTFIKIDVQGADGEVLLGARETLRRCQPVVTFEWEEELAASFSVSLDMLKKELKSLGYGLHLLKRHNKKQADYVAYPTPASGGGRTARK